MRIEKQKGRERRGRLGCSEVSGWRGGRRTRAEESKGGPRYPALYEGPLAAVRPAGALFQDRTESGTTIALISTRMPCRRPPRCNGARRWGRQRSESSRWVRDLALRSLSSPPRSPPPACCLFLSLTSRVLKFCWVLTVSRETNVLLFQNKSYMFTTSHFQSQLFEFFDFLH